MEISKDPETGEVVTISRVLLPALKRQQHGEELSCEVGQLKHSFKRRKRNALSSFSPRWFIRGPSFLCG